MSNGFLGIDESNHGGSPEIFVGVYSSNDEDIVEMLKLSKKIKDKDIFPLLEDRDFRFIKMLYDDKEEFTYNQIKLLIINEFIQIFQPKLTVVDGFVDESILEKLKTINPETKINCEPKADEKYKLVNISHRIANNLHTSYNKKNGREHERYMNKFEEYLIEPNYDFYKNNLFCIKREHDDKNKHREPYFNKPQIISKYPYKR